MQISKLEKLANDYGIKVTFVPKFHCELNAIEGVWCHEKQFVRKYSDQTFNKMVQLIPQAKSNFVEKNLFMKLFRRFWTTITAYEQGQSYAKVLELFFSNHCSQAVISHRRITNSNLDNA